MKNIQIALVLIVMLKQIAYGQVNTPNGVYVPASALFVYSAVKYSPTAGSTIINNQNSGTVNFTFNGPSNNGGLSIAFCGAPRHSFTFFKPSGYKMEVYPNPVKDEEVISISDGSVSDIQAINMDGKANNLVRLRLLDDRQRIVQDYLPNVDGSVTTIKVKPGLKGTYFLQATFEDGTVQRKRVVIEK